MKQRLTHQENKGRINYFASILNIHWFIHLFIYFNVISTDVESIRYLEVREPRLIMNNYW